MTKWNFWLRYKKHKQWNYSKLTRVLLLIAFFKLSKLVASTKSIAIPWREVIFENRRFVPPYTSSHEIMWSPLLKSCVIIVVVPRPLQYVSPYFPLSNDAKHFSSTSRVGLPLRPYSYDCKTKKKFYLNRKLSYFVVVVFFFFIPFVFLVLNVSNLFLIFKQKTFFFLYLLQSSTKNTVVSLIHGTISC